MNHCPRSVMGDSEAYQVRGSQDDSPCIYRRAALPYSVEEDEVAGREYHMQIVIEQGTRWAML